jgi:hypothetical protein
LNNCFFLNVHLNLEIRIITNIVLVQYKNKMEVLRALFPGETVKEVPYNPARISFSEDV